MVAAGDEIFVRPTLSQQFKYSLPVSFVDKVVQILGPETFNINQIHEQQQQFHDTIDPQPMVRLDKCLEFIHGIPARCPGTNPNKWLVLTRPFELVLLDSCLPLLEIPPATINGDPQRLIQKLISIGYTDIYLDEFSNDSAKVEMLIDRLKDLDRYDQLFSHSAFKDMIENRLTESLETKSLLGKPDLHMEFLFSLGAKLSMQPDGSDRVDNNLEESNRQMIYGECFHDQIVKNLAQIKLVATTSYVRVVKKSIENVVSNCAKQIEKLLNYEIIYGKYGNETIEATLRYNMYMNNENSNRASHGYSEQQYGLMDALEDILLISSGRFHNANAENFDEAVRDVAKLNLEKLQDSVVLSANVMSFLAERARVVFYRSFHYLTPDMANYIYSNHIMMACNKLTETCSGRIEAYNQAYKHLDLEVRSNRLMEGGDSTMVANIVYQASKICNKLDTIMPLLEVTIEPLPIAVNSIFSDSPQERF